MIAAEQDLNPAETQNHDLFLRCVPALRHRRAPLASKPPKRVGFGIKKCSHRQHSASKTLLSSFFTAAIKPKKSPVRHGKSSQFEANP